MAEIDPFAVGQSALDSVSVAGTYIVWGVLAVVVVVGLIYFMSFRHTVSIRVLNKHGQSLPFRDKAREFKKDGGRYWQFLKRRDVIPVPNSESLIQINGGGKPKYYAEFSWSEENGYVPLVYDITTDNFQDRVIVTQHGKRIEDGFQPLTTSQRSLFVGQLRKSEERKKKDLLERITQLATPLIIAMLFVMVLLFWEDIAKPAKEMSELNVKMQEKNNQLLEQMAEISAQNARVASIYTGEPIEIEQRITE